MREIVTLQLGELGNYLGTHFWNAQESYLSYDENGDQSTGEPLSSQQQQQQQQQQKSLPAVNPNVHWRAGIGRDGAETFLPRVLVYDAKTAFGSLRAVNPLYEEVAEAADSVGVAIKDSLWRSQPAVRRLRDPVTPSPYQRALDAGAIHPARPAPSTVRYWSDVSRVYLHPRSVVAVHDDDFGSAAGSAASPQHSEDRDAFATGVNLFAALDAARDIVDADWRPWVEECDAIQGIQIMATLDDAWAGFAASYLEALRDEHPKIDVWLWAPRASPPPKSAAASRAARRLRTTNTALALARTCAMASVVVPLALPDSSAAASTLLPSTLTLNPSQPWHLSALFCTAMETTALPSRLAAQAGCRTASLVDMSNNLDSARRRTLVSAALATGPRAFEPDAEMLDLANLLPSYPGKAGAIARTASDSDSRRPPHVFGQLSVRRGAHAEDFPADSQGDNQNDSAARHSYASSLPFPLLSSFPSIFPDTPSDVLAGTAPATDDASSLSVRTVLSTDSSIATRVKMLQAQAMPFVSLDEREAIGSNLMDLADAYQDGWSSGSDDGDDDL